MSNSFFQAAISLQNEKRPPVWFMRQAGRYHKHYQGIRNDHSFMEMCKDSDLAAKVALGPIGDFNFDIAILFSDLLFPLEAVGMGLQYKDNVGPVLDWYLDRENIGDLKTGAYVNAHLDFQKDAMLKTRQLLPKHKSLIGFVGGPWTLFAYAVDGTHKGGLNKSLDGIDMFPQFCEKVLDLLKYNIQIQLDGGAEVVMLLDTAAGDLSANDYHQKILPWTASLANAFPQKLAYYSKGTTPQHINGYFYSEMKNFKGLGFDASWDMCSLLKEVPENFFIQGNFDQQHMSLEMNEFKDLFYEWLDPILSLDKKLLSRWICGLGHGLLPQSRESNVRYFVEHIQGLEV